MKLKYSKPILIDGILLDTEEMKDWIPVVKYSIAKRLTEDANISEELLNVELMIDSIYYESDRHLCVQWK